MTRLIIIVLTFLFGSLASAEATMEKEENQWLSDWQKESGEDGISASCRQHRNKINQCRFTAVVDDSITALAAVILDVDNQKSWALNVLTSERLSPSESKYNFYVYTVYDFIGAYDRDAVTRYVAEQNPETKVVKIKFMSVNQEGPKKDLRLVRFPLIAGYWQFKPLSNGQTELEHVSFAPPGGVVQKTLYPFYNRAYLSGAFANIRALKKEARKAKYQTADLRFVQDLEVNRH